MPRDRFDLLRLVLVSTLSLAAACNRPPPQMAVLGKTSDPVLATFEGSYDPATQKLTITPTAVATPNGLVAFQPWQDGVAGSGPDNTLEMVTVSSGANPNGCGAGLQSFDGAIAVRSFYRNQTFSNVYVELTALSPTGYEGCNSDPPVTGVSSASGLWSYGTLQPVGGTNAATRTWSFRFPDSAQRFTFTGRIMADLGVPSPLAGAPEFDWSPSSIVTPPRSFVEETTTLSHVVWNGLSFTDTKSALNFVRTGAAATDHPIGLWSPAQHYADFNNGTTYFTASGNSIDTSGAFTACVKFKPGPHPTLANPNQVLFAKGKPEADVSGEGWALMQMHYSYCFHYRTAQDNSPWVADVMSLFDLRTEGSNNPENFTYDYICGGRNLVGGYILVDAHGRQVPGATTSETGSFTSAASLAYSIGAYPDGTHQAFTQGVYELIVDSRPATAAVMNEIVSLAEGRQLPAPDAGGARTYQAGYANGTAVTGANGATYTLPPFATNPIADSSGFLTEGAVVSYTHPLVEDTRGPGFCVGAEVKADAAWSAVSGGLLDAGGFFISLNGSFLFRGSGYAQVLDNWSTESAWPSGSVRAFLACVAPQPGNVTLYVYDPAATPISRTVVASGATGGVISNLSDPAMTLVIGKNGAQTPNTLTGARIRRIFMCPSSDPAACH